MKEEYKRKFSFEYTNANLNLAKVNVQKIT